ncbi:MAG: amino acid ABC transporter permease [Hydrotalea sp.]|nr:amino acid ABC transporter permease [Hydrotalea sp.]
MAIFSKSFYWLHKNLFSSWWSSFFTLLIIGFLYYIVPMAAEWFFFDASIATRSVRECYDVGFRGACWGFIPLRWKLFLFYLYPAGELWRVLLAFLLLFVALVPIFKSNFKTPGRRKKFFYFTIAYPFIAYWLIGGGLFLTPVGASQVGGFMLNIIVGVSCIAISFPLSILVALARRSRLFFLSKMTVLFVEVVRGVPLLMLIFVAATMLNYFLPTGAHYSLLFRVVIMVTMFSTVYLSEVMRGGLNALPRGQAEAASAIGLNYWQGLQLVILPQMLKACIPSIVNIFIGMFMDTTLVAVVSMYDALGAGKATMVSSDWKAAGREIIIFVAAMFFVCCFCISRFSAHLEKKLKTEHAR